MPLSFQTVFELPQQMDADGMTSAAAPLNLANEIAALLESPAVQNSVSTAMVASLKEDLGVDASDILVAPVVASVSPVDTSSLMT